MVDLPASPASDGDGSEPMSHRERRARVLIAHFENAASLCSPPNEFC
jgi:hypothetical protein